MNMDYIYRNGEIHVIDDNNRQKTIKYTDNFLDKLKVENNIEYLKDILDKNEIVLEELSYELLPSKIRYILSALCYGEIFYIEPFIANKLFGFEYNPADKKTPLIMGIVGLMTGLLINNNLKDCKEAKSKVKGLLYTKELLTLMLEDEENYYESLKEDNKKDNEDKYKKIYNRMKIDFDLEKNKINDYYIASFVYGSNKNKILRLYNNNRLDELAKVCDEEGNFVFNDDRIELVEELIESEKLEELKKYLKKKK